MYMSLHRVYMCIDCQIRIYFYKHVHTMSVSYTDVPVFKHHDVHHDTMSVHGIDMFVNFRLGTVTDMSVHI